MTPSKSAPQYKTLVCALLFGCGPALASEAFVHFPGSPGPGTAFKDRPEGVNPQIERLLLTRVNEATRPGGQHADLWERIRQGFAMPGLDHKVVAQQAGWYAARPDLIQSIVARARPYLYFIVDEVERRGLPTELALLPFIESGFNPLALSSAQAAGLWQFIPGTGAKYKLAQTSLYDGRRDVVASTGAALDYMQFLYHYNNGDWHKALASYNWGEAAVARAVERNRARNLSEAYESLTMPEETRNYVPRLLAIKNIIMDPAAFGVQLPEIANEPVFHVVPNPQDLDLKLAAQLAGIRMDEFLTLNPAYNRGHAPGSVGAGLAIPLEKAELFRANLERHRESLAKPKAAARW